MTSADPLRVVEAGYQPIEDDSAWLRGIVEAALPCGVGTGLAAWTVDLSRDRRIDGFAAKETRDSFEHEIRAFDRSFDAATARAVYAPTEFVGNSVHRLRRLARSRGVEVEQITTHVVEAYALVAGDPRKRALVLAFPGERTGFHAERAFPGSRVLGLAGAHLAAAIRLRSMGAQASADDTSVESVLTPEGRVLHATGEARASKHRLSLVEAVVQRERARGRLRRVDPAEAASLWSVLVDGRWSIVDFVDRDGKRMLLARKNAVEGPDVLALTDEERDVLWLTTLGHSYKYIAYELGLSIAIVSRRLASALRKLRVPSRRELLRRLGGPTAEPANDDG